MWTSVLGLFSQDLALDLGTSNIRVLTRGGNTIAEEPSVVALHTGPKGRRRVLALGEEARAMLGRTPPDIDAVQPIRGGQIQEYAVAEALLIHLVRRVHGRNTWMSPRMVVAVPSLATEMERRAVRECCESAGAREVVLVPRPIAAALGAELPIHEPAGQMVVDVGGGGTEVSVLSLSGLVASEWVPGGGEGMDQALAKWLESEHQLLIGRSTAEQLKIAATVQGAGAQRFVAKGRCASTGVPRAVEISGGDVERALTDTLGAIGKAIRRLLERVPPEVASDVVDHGIVLVGGGARMGRLDAVLRGLTGLAVVVAEGPEQAVVRGTGRVLETAVLQRRVAS